MDQISISSSSISFSTWSDFTSLPSLSSLLRSESLPSISLLTSSESTSSSVYVGIAIDEDVNSTDDDHLVDEDNGICLGCLKATAWILGSDFNQTDTTRSDEETPAELNSNVVLLSNSPRSDVVGFPQSGKLFCLSNSPRSDTGFPESDSELFVLSNSPKSDVVGSAESESKCFILSNSPRSVVEEFDE